MLKTKIELYNQRNNELIMQRLNTKNSGMKLKS